MAEAVSEVMDIYPKIPRAARHVIDVNKPDIGLYNPGTGFWDQLINGSSTYKYGTYTINKNDMNDSYETENDSSS